MIAPSENGTHEKPSLLETSGLMRDAVVMTLDEVRATAEQLLLAQGFNDRHAQAIARTVTAAERDECRHHGLFRISFYINALRAGQASPDAEPTISSLAPGIVRVDAHRGFSPLALECGDEPLARLAKQQGIAALVVNNALNVAALWPEVERLAERGLVAFAYVSAIPYVAPAGGTKPAPRGGPATVTPTGPGAGVTPTAPRPGGGPAPAKPPTP